MWAYIVVNLVSGWVYEMGQRASSTIERVRQYLEKDIVIASGLDRGIINFRRAARWFIEDRGWDDTEGAIVSALRRCSPDHGPKLDESHEALRGVRTRLETGWALVETDARNEAQERIREAFDVSKESASILPGESVVTYLLRNGAATTLQEDHGQDLVAIHNPVTRVGVELPKEGSEAFMVLNIVLGIFSSRGIQLLDVFSSGREYSLIVPAEHTDEAHDALLHLREDPSES